MDDPRDLTTQIVAAYVEKHRLDAAELPQLIKSIYRSLSTVGEATAVADVASEPPKATAAQIRKSLTPDYIVSFEDGRHYRTMKRHLGRRGLTPAAYRAKWGLPSSYPMVAPSYSEARSALAKSMGLGAKRSPALAKAGKPRAKKPAPAKPK